MISNNVCWFSPHAFILLQFSLFVLGELRDLFQSAYFASTDFSSIGYSPENLEKLVIFLLLLLLFPFSFLFERRFFCDWLLILPLSDLSMRSAALFFSFELYSPHSRNAMRESRIGSEGKRKVKGEKGSGEFSRIDS